jgi:hypothetical protein
MSSQNQIFSLLLVLSFLWYMCHRHPDSESESEHFVVNNTIQVPPMVADNVYQYNHDLAYESNRNMIVPLTLAENVETRRIAPVIQPTQGQVVSELYSGVTVPDARRSTRIPDDISTQTQYNIPTSKYDDAQGGFQNTNNPIPPHKNPVWNSNFIYQSK